MKLFGTDGIRGVVGGEKINPEVAARLGQALVLFCRKRDLPERIIIARDTRESGPMLESAVVKGITSAGADAVFAGVLPTPVLAWLVRSEKAGAGLMISASHNPFRDNGFKPFTSEGIKLTEDEEKELENYIFGGEKEKKGISPGKIARLDNAKDKYTNFVLEKMPAELRGNGFNVVLDCSNGADFELAPLVFSKVLKSVHSISASPDGKNINDRCGSQYPENLQKEVVAKKADLGLAFDGDGDRVIAVDEKGRVLTGDHMIYAIAKMLKERGKLKNDLVITTVMSNLGFVSNLKKMGINHVATAVGDQPVLREMQESGAVLGGEESGHVIYSDFHPAGDGIIGGIMLTAALSYFRKTLSELAAEVKLFPKILVNVEVKSRPDLATVPEISAAIKEVEEKVGEEGRVLVRYSGTENLCRVMVEGKNKLEVKEYAEKIAKIIKKNIG